MKKFIGLLIFLVSSFSPSSSFAAPASFTTFTGTIMNAQGSMFTGKMVLVLPFAGMTTLEGYAVSPAPVTFQIYNGNVFGVNQVISNGDMLPANSHYVAQLFDMNGSLIQTTNLYIPLGSTFNLGTALLTTVTTGNISLVTPASLTATTQTWTGINIYNGATTFNGFVTFNGGTNLTANAILPAAQVGDSLRFNTNGDGLWDAVNTSQQSVGAYTVIGGSPVAFGVPAGTGFAPGQGTGDVFPTATVSAGRTFTAGAAASPNVIVGISNPQNGSNALLPILAWYRMTFKVQLNATSGLRYWWGMANWNTGSATGTNNLHIVDVASAKFATDTPNSNTIGFRFSSGTDTTFKAVSCVAAGSCTVTDTTVTVDTAVHTFDITTNAAGNSLQYYVDNILRATITTNIPPVSGQSTQQDGLGELFLCGDNKNTNTALSVTFYNMQVSLK